MTSKRPTEPFDKLAPELGHITINWGVIESMVDDFIKELARLDEKDVSNAILGNADLRGKISMAKALAFVRRPTDDWFDAATKTLDRIDNDIRVRRNQFVHARWMQPKRRSLIRRSRKTTKLREVRRLAKDMQDAVMDPFMLFVFIIRDETNPHSSPPIPYKEYLRLAARVDRLQRRAGAGPVLLPRSLEGLAYRLQMTPDELLALVPESEKGKASRPSRSPRPNRKKPSAKQKE
jgi:hypothetical protein